MSGGATDEDAPTAPPDAVFDTRHLPMGVEGEMMTRIESLTLGGVHVDLLGETDIVLNAGPGPTTVTVSLFVGTVSFEPITD